MINMFNSNKIVVNNTVTKSFSYQAKNVSLNFNLPIDDDKKNLKEFLELLKLATADVESEIEK